MCGSQIWWRGHKYQTMQKHIKMQVTRSNELRHVWLFSDQKKLNNYQRQFIENTRFCSLQVSGSFAAFAFIQRIHSRNDLKSFEGFLPLWLSSEIIDCGQQRLDLTGSNVQWLMVRWDNCSTKWDETLRISWTITTHSSTVTQLHFLCRLN